MDKTDGIVYTFLWDRMKQLLAGQLKKACQFIQDGDNYELE